jgi:hypothetical protein
MDANRILGHIELIPAGAARIFAGKAVINYNQTAWNSLASGYGPTPVLTLSAFFNQAQANALTQSQILTNEPADDSYTNEIYAMNGASVTNLPDRNTQPTTFIYQRGNLTNEIGGIGLGGVARFAVFGGAGGSLLYGDYTLQYDPSRITEGGTGWYLEENISGTPPEPAFDLLNVTVGETTNAFTISGELGVSEEYAAFYNTPGDGLAEVGTFSFTGDTAPLTTPVISQLTAAGGHLVLQATNGLASSGYTLLSTTNLALPNSAWTTTTTGSFDGNGVSSNAITINPTEPARFFQLQQP